MMSESSEGNKSMKPFSPALGLIFGVPVGALFGIILKQDIAIFAGVGAGLGLVLGAMTGSFFSKKR
jgi:F0F1-type ATP synthase assembly protein I